MLMGVNQLTEYDYPKGTVIFYRCHCFENFSGTCCILFLAIFILLMQTRNERVKIVYVVIIIILLPCMMEIFLLHPSEMEITDSLTSENASVSHASVWVDFRNAGCLVSALSRSLPPPTCQSSRDFREEMY